MDSNCVITWWDEEKNCRLSSMIRNIAIVEKDIPFHSRVMMSGGPESWPVEGQGLREKKLCHTMEDQMLGINWGQFCRGTYEAMWWPSAREAVVECYKRNLDWAGGGLAGHQDTFQFQWYYFVTLQPITFHHPLQLLIVLHTTFPSLLTLDKSPSC